MSSLAKPAVYITAYSYYMYRAHTMWQPQDLSGRWQSDFLLPGYSRTSGNINVGEIEHKRKRSARRTCLKLRSRASYLVAQVFFSSLASPVFFLKAAISPLSTFNSASRSCIAIDPAHVRPIRWSKHSGRWKHGCACKLLVKTSSAQRHAILYKYEKSGLTCNTRSPASKSLRYPRINYELLYQVCAKSARYIAQSWYPHCCATC